MWQPAETLARRDTGRSSSREGTAAEIRFRLPQAGSLRHADSLDALGGGCNLASIAVPCFITVRLLFPLLSFAAAFLVSACEPSKYPAAPMEVQVFAAASLTDALKDLTAPCERSTGIRLKFVFGGSQALARQIEAGDGVKRDGASVPPGRVTLRLLSVEGLNAGADDAQEGRACRPAERAGR